MSILEHNQKVLQILFYDYLTIILQQKKPTPHFYVIGLFLLFKLQYTSTIFILFYNILFCTNKLLILE